MNLTQRARYSHAPTVKPLEFELSHLRERHASICTRVISLTPVGSDFGKNSPLYDFLPPQPCDPQSPSEPTSSETHVLSQHDHHTEHQTSQMKLDLTSRNHLKYFEVEYCNRC